MRTIDADALYRKVKAECNPYGKPSIGWKDGQRMMEWIEHAPTVDGWISADKRPPKQGRYLVWGLTRITPDHYDEANGFWEIQPASWFEKSGWDRKVKFWQMLPEPPNEADA